MHGLSILSRGSMDEKLRWTFSLYDINGDGRITREEMTDIVTAVYDLMGKIVEPTVEDGTVAAKVDRIFQVHSNGCLRNDGWGVKFVDICLELKVIVRK